MMSRTSCTILYSCADTSVHWVHSHVVDTITTAAHRGRAITTVVGVSISIAIHAEVGFATAVAIMVSASLVRLIQSWVFMTTLLKK